MSAYEREIAEKDLERQVRDLAAALGWKRYHTYRSKRSEPGWPDEALVRDRLVLLELKSAAGKLSAAQKAWLRALVDAGAECYVVRPADLEALAAILSLRNPGLEHIGAQVLRERTAAEIA